jgi:hypothetical protein
MSHERLEERYNGGQLTIHGRQFGVLSRAVFPLPRALPTWVVTTEKETTK